MSTATDLGAYPALTASDLGTSTELRDFHTSTEPRIVRILAQAPGYVDARRALLRVLARKTPVPVAQDATEVLHDLIVAAATTGEPIPSSFVDLMPDIGGVPVHEGRNYDLGVRIVANAPEALLAKVEADAVRRAVDTIRAQLDGILQANISAILAAITEELQDLVDAARKALTGRGRIHDAEDAIVQDRVEEWQHSQRLAADYAELRRLQRSWSSRVGFTGGRSGTGPDNYGAYVANPEAVFVDLPRFQSGRPYRSPSDETAFERAGITAPQWTQDWTAGEAIWWFATHRDATPWAPTLQQWEAQRDRLVNAAVAHHRGAPRRRTAADPLPEATAVDMVKTGSQS